MQSAGLRVALAAIVVAAIVALLVWARNDPGVDDRDPDPPQSTESSRRTAADIQRPPAADDVAVDGRDDTWARPSSPIELGDAADAADAHVD